jgi:hypothetical protein
MYRQIHTHLCIKHGVQISVSVNHNALYEGITFSIILGDYGLSKNENIAFKTFHWQILV